MSALFLTFIQGFILLLLAPLSLGFVRLFKARLQGRKGASPFLIYFTLLTLLKKELVISTSTSWVFRLVPFVVLGSSLFLIFTLPLLGVGGLFASFSDFIFVSGVLTLSAVFLVLGGLDSASAFGGMGSSREMTIASLLEPTIVVTFATLVIASGTNLLDGVLIVGGQGLWIHPELFLTILALLLIALAENARYPVDNPATHLELTMVHEAMVLEYSGPYLAMLEYASTLKLTIFALLIANLFAPIFLLSAGWGIIELVIGCVLIVLKLIILMFALALLESSIAKMRFFRVQEYLSLAFFIALTGLILTVL